MNLYIWDDPYSVRFGSSLLVAAANSLDEAKEVAARSTGGRWTHMKGPWPDPGEPTRVIENFPYAEWHEWSE